MVLKDPSRFSLLISIAKPETYFGKLPVGSASIASVVVSTRYLG
jgi:hypothetical protein